MSCSSCGAPVLWAVSRAGESIPFDPGPDELGEYVLEPGDSGELVAVHSPAIEGQLALLEPDTRPRHRAHWSTCPFADEHRRRVFT